MTYSNRGNDRSRSTFYGKPSFSDRGTERAELHDAICAKCGSACQVPFVPNGRKEVFCSRCFSEMNGGDRDSRNSQRYERTEARGSRMSDHRDGRSIFSDKQMFDTVCDQCGKNCQVPFRPTQGKPVLCSNCFSGKPDMRSHTPVRNTNIDLEAINAKLDRIIKLLSPVTPKAESEEITKKILEEIQDSSEKALAETSKKTKKTVSKKKIAD